MTTLKIWFETAQHPPEAINLDDNLPTSRLKAELLKRLAADDQLINPKADYEVVCLRTGTILPAGSTPVSYLVNNDDHFVLREASSAYAAADTTGIEPAGSSPFNTSPAAPDTRVTERTKSFTGAFSITGIAPFPLNFSDEYPVFAIRCRHEFGAAIRKPFYRENAGQPQPRGKVIYAKDYFFLTADKDRRFKWVLIDKSSHYLPDVNYLLREPGTRRLTRYSLGKDHGEKENMIYPVRSFSITGISMDGFDPTKEYPVLAIDTDQYVKENPEPGEEGQEPQPSTQSIAFFLVGDDNGEFAWIAEDECRLYPIKVQS
jgi:hypothetical protein